MPHVICSTDHTKTNSCKVTHSTIIVSYGTGPTASSPWLDAVDLFQL